MVCLFWKVNKLNGNFWSRTWCQDREKAKWKIFRRPKFLNQIDGPYSETKYTISGSTRVVWNSCKSSLISLRLPCLKPPNVKLKSKHNIICKIQFHDSTSKYNLELAYRRKKTQQLQGKEGQRKWRKSHNLEHLHSFKPTMVNFLWC